MELNSRVLYSYANINSGSTKTTGNPNCVCRMKNNDCICLQTGFTCPGSSRVANVFGCNSTSVYDAISKAFNLVAFSNLIDPNIPPMVTDPKFPDFDYKQLPIIVTYTGTSHSRYYQPDLTHFHIWGEHAGDIYTNFAKNSCPAMTGGGIDTDIIMNKYPYDATKHFERFNTSFAPVHPSLVPLQLYNDGGYGPMMINNIAVGPRGSGTLKEERNGNEVVTYIINGYGLKQTNNKYVLRSQLTNLVNEYIIDHNQKIYIPSKCNNTDEAYEIYDFARYYQSNKSVNYFDSIIGSDTKTVFNPYYTPPNPNTNNNVSLKRKKKNNNNKGRESLSILPLLSTYLEPFLSGTTYFNPNHNHNFGYLN